MAVLTKSGQARDTAAMLAVADRTPDRQWAVELLRLVSPDTVLWAAAALTALAAVAGLAVAAVLAVPPALRELAAAAGVAAVALTGLAAVTLQWHRPSDILASALLAAAVGGLAVFVTGGGGPQGRLAPACPAGAVRAARAE